jgi:hypothetical protein
MAYMKKEEPIIPAPPVPSMVRMSIVPPPPTAIEKEREEKLEVVDTQTVGEKSEVVFIPLKEGEEEAKGTIVIRIFENSPYETDFEGAITGVEVDMAWKAMMKGYRIWKSKVFKQLDEQKKMEDSNA